MNDHDDLSGMGRMSEEEGLRQVMEAIISHGAYPQGNPAPVKVELSDEQWNAVVLAIRMIITANFTEGSRIVPDFLIEQMHHAYHAIYGSVQETIGELVADELIEEATRE